MTKRPSRKKKPSRKRQLPVTESRRSKPILPPALSQFLGSGTFAALGLLLLWAVMEVVYLVAEYNQIGGFGYGLDDSWIHATFARNLAEGRGFTFNPGEPVSGSTAPLYTAMLALWYLIFDEVIWGGKLMGMVGLLVAGGFLYLAAERLGGRRVAWVAAALCFISPLTLLSSLNGMELGVYLISPCAALYAYTQKRYGWMTAALSVGVWLRPEALLLLGLGWLAVPKRNKLVTLGLGAAIVLPYFAFNFWLGDYPLPGTVRTKAAFQSAHFSYTFIKGALPLFTGAHFLPIFLLVPFGFWALWKKAWWVALFPPLFFFVNWAMFLTPSSYQRYLHPMLPYLFLTMAFSIVWLESRKATWARWVLWAIPVLLLLQLRMGYGIRGTHALAIGNITNMQVGIAKMMSQITMPSDTIATNDVGALGYFSQRYIIDLAGLISPKRSFEENLHDFQPAVLVIFERWFPQRFESPTFMNRYKKLGFVDQVPNVVCGDSRMTLFARDDRYEGILNHLKNYQ